MIYLLFCILFSAGVLVAFKFTERFEINTFSAILVNYATAFLAGIIIAHGDFKPLLTLKPGMIIFMLLLGILCITVFRLLGMSIKYAGVAVTTVSSKMSVIIPILFSIYIDNHDSISAQKVIGITLALIAVSLTVFKKERLIGGNGAVFLPVLIFLGIGAIDSSIKYAQTTFVTNEMNSIFNSAVFAIAGIAGILLLPFNKGALNDFKKQKTWLLGIILGIVNFSSMFFMVAALNYINADTGISMQGSVLFGINNLSVVLINVLIGLLLFKEQVTRTNWVGILLSFMSIAVLALI